MMQSWRVFVSDWSGGDRRLWGVVTVKKNRSNVMFAVWGTYENLLPLCVILKKKKKKWESKRFHSLLFSEGWRTRCPSTHQSNITWTHISSHPSLMCCERQSIAAQTLGGFWQRKVGGPVEVRHYGELWPHQTSSRRHSVGRMCSQRYLKFFYIKSINT